MNNKRMAYTFAKYEHKFENLTNIVMVITLIVTYFMKINLVVFSLIILLVTIHTIARICHVFEKHYFNKERK